MEAASRPPLEALEDLPLELAPEGAEPSKGGASTAAAAAAAPAAAPAKDPAQTGITLLDPSVLELAPDVAPEPAPSAAPPAATATKPEPELVLEDPAVVEELLTSAPPPPAKAAAPAAAASPATKSEATAAEPARETRVPLVRTASLSAAATKSAATKLAAASRRAAESAPPKPARAAIPVVRPAPPAPPAKAPTPEAASAAGAEGLAAWTSARASAPKPQPKPPVIPTAPPAASAPKSAAPKAAPPAAPAATASAAPAGAMDRDYIARNQVVERYLSGRLPLKGATEFEQWIARHPELLDEIGLPERVNAGLRLLEASGKPEPWQEAPRPAWQKPQVTIALAIACGALAVVAMVFTGTGASKTHRIEELQRQVREQPLDPATSTREIRVMPSRSGATNAPAITIGGGGAQLADFKIDESRSPYHIFRVTIDRIDQGRVGVITNLAKDSNGHLRIALNSTALGPGAYQLTIEGLNWRGDPEPDSWVTIGIAR
jgi:hypothetical protein